MSKYHKNWGLGIGDVGLDGRGVVVTLDPESVAVIVIEAPAPVSGS